jgi:hypothetical protein
MDTAFGDVIPLLACSDPSVVDRDADETARRALTEASEAS